MLRKVGSLVAAAILVVLMVPGVASSDSAHTATVANVEFLGEAIIDTGALFDGTEIGGLSSITYLPGPGLYAVVSDDQGNRDTGDPVRYYTADIDLRDGTLDTGDVTFVNVTELFDARHTPFAPGGLDPEGFTFHKGRFFFSSEGNTLSDPIIDPFIRRYSQSGRALGDLPIPDHYLSNGVDTGVRFNLSFESLNPTPDGQTLITAGEGALFQDGPASTFDNGSLARILAYDLGSRTPMAEYVYEVAPWAEPSAIFGVNGIVEVLPIDNDGSILVLERSFSVGGVGGGGTANVVVLRQISTTGATDVLDSPALYEDGVPIDYTPVVTETIFEFDDLGIPIDNIEGMTFGPDLPDGRRTLVIVSDNNFSATQFTQFIVLALDIETS